MDADKIHEMSQAAADIREQFTPLLWGFYQALELQGFSAQQAFDLTKTYMVCILNETHKGNEPGEI